MKLDYERNYVSDEFQSVFWCTQKRMRGVALLALLRPLRSSSATSQGCLDAADL